MRRLPVTPNRKPTPSSPHTRERLAVRRERERRRAAVPREALFKIIDELSQIQKDLPISWVSLLLHAAAEDDNSMGGSSVTDLANTAGLSTPTVSRVLRVLGGGLLGRGPFGGSGLVYLAPDGKNHRVRRVCLTEQGKALVQRLNHLVAEPL